jgi:uncharacterized damage-inducible protein DinB
MTDLQQRLVARLALVRADLDEAIGRLNDADLSWAPTEGMRTLGGQLQEIAATERQVLLLLKEGPGSDFDSIFRECERETVAEFVELLRATRAETLALIASLSDEELETPRPMPKGWFEALGLERTPVSEVIRSIAQHEWYHVGQIVSYLWSRGDNPYKWHESP